MAITIFLVLSGLLVPSKTGAASQVVELDVPVRLEGVGPIGPVAVRLDSETRELLEVHEEIFTLAEEVAAAPPPGGSAWWTPEELEEQGYTVSFETEEVRLLL